MQTSEETSYTLAPGELRWAGLAAAAVVILSCLPYLFGWYLRPADFMGHVYNADDANVHLAWMRQAAEGRWLFVDRFTSEAQQPQFTNLFFVLLGRIAAVFGGWYGALIVVYHLARVVMGWALLVLVYLLASYLYRSVSIRRLALLAAGLSSGLGWVTTLLGRGDWSLDFGSGLMMPEAVTFLSLYVFPLFVASMALLVGLYLLLLRAFDTGRVAPAIGAGLLGLVLGHIHSYDVPPLYATIAAYLVVLGLRERRLPVREAGLAAVVVVLSLPAPVHQFVVFRSNHIFQQRALHATLSPEPWRYALTFGLVLAVAVVGAARLPRTAGRHGALLVVWAAVTLAMAYAPQQHFAFQRKMIEGIHIPLAILAAAGWLSLAPRALRTPRAVAAWSGLFLLLTVPSNFCAMADSARRLVDNNARGVVGLLPPYYLDGNERAALDWLKQNQGRGVVLSTPLVGAYMPAYSGATTYVSHWAETMDYTNKLRQLRRFYRPETDDAWRRAFLSGARIRSVYHGGYERALQQDAPGAFDPAAASFLRPVFRADTMGAVPVTIYEVVR